MSPLDRLTRRRHEHGFSLIELMVVLLIIAILLAVAIPTYLSARDRAENRAAQETLTHAAEAAMIAETGSNGGVGPNGTGRTSLAASLGPGVTLVGVNPVSKAGQVSFYNFAGLPNELGVMKMASWSPAGVCWVVIASRDVIYPWPSSNHPPGPGVYYSGYKSPKPDQCSQGWPNPPSSVGWSSSWSQASAANGL